MLATRSPYRPNPIGLSCVQLESVVGDTLELSGVDLVDGTPILDIKPYIPAYDRPSAASITVPEWVLGAGKPLCSVSFAAQALQDVGKIDTSKLRLHRSPDELLGTIRDVLAADPRPVYRQLRARDSGSYAFQVDSATVTCRFQSLSEDAHDAASDAASKSWPNDAQDAASALRGHFEVETVRVT